MHPFLSDRYFRVVSSLGFLLALITYAAITAGCSKANPNKLLQTAKAGDVNGFSRELAKGFDPQTLYASNEHWDDTPFHEAAATGSTPILELLLDRGVMPDLQLANRVTAMELAIDRNHPAIVEKLLARGADPNREMSEYLTPLAAAAMTGNVPITKLLVAHGAQVNKITGEIPNRLTPLACASSVQIAEILIAAGAKVNVPAGMGLSPLDAAIYSTPPKRDVVLLLIKHGARAEGPSLQTAREKLGREVAEMLLANEKNPAEQRIKRDVFCKDCRIPKNSLVDALMRMQNTQ